MNRESLFLSRLANLLLFSRWQNEELIPYFNKYINKSRVQKKLQRDTQHSIWLLEHGFDFLIDIYSLLKSGNYDLIVYKIKDINQNQGELEQYCQSALGNFKVLQELVSHYAGNVLNLFQKLNLYGTLLKNAKTNQI